MRYAQKKRVETTKEDSQSRRVLSRFVICFGQSVLCYCCILPICIGPDLLCQFPTWLARMHMHGGVYFMPLSSSFPICSRFQQKRGMLQGFLSIFLAASTERGLIPRTNQTIWSLQSYDVLRRRRTGMLFDCVGPVLLFFQYLSLFI